MRANVLIAIGVCCLLGIASGCDTDAPQHPSTWLVGKVTVYGEPLPSGIIQFIPLGKNQGPDTWAKIVDGRYRAEKVPLGRVLAVFSSQRRTHQLPSDVEGEEKWAVENLIPKKDLKGKEIEVEAGQTTQDFHLGVY